ncbi:hypothetical protein FOA52_003008 [Chlamydomonas sp. UWO 241]|nr:hypothetical protein FOA52_003008 [Chlamydomonas sp. UWO 241]
MRHAVWVDGALNDGDAESKGWSVEMAIPWSILGMAANRPSPPAPGDQWRINFSRVQWRVRWDAEARVYVKDLPMQAEANWVWSPQYEVAMHKPETWGYVQFSSVLAVLATPTATATAKTSSTTTGGRSPKAALSAATTAAAATGRNRPGAAEALPTAVAMHTQQPAAVVGSPAGAAAAAAGAAAAGPADVSAAAAAAGYAYGAAAGAAAAGAAAEAAPAPAATHMQQPADSAGTAFVPDPSWPLRCFLMQGYYAQAKRKATSQLFAGSMAELGLNPPERAHAVRPLVQATEASFIVTAQMPAPVGSDTLRYYVNEEGRITWRTVAAAEGD